MSISLGNWERRGLYLQDERERLRLCDRLRAAPSSFFKKEIFYLLCGPTWPGTLTHARTYVRRHTRACAYFNLKPANAEFACLRLPSAETAGVKYHGRLRSSYSPESKGHFSFVNSFPQSEKVHTSTIGYDLPGIQREAPDLSPLWVETRSADLRR